MSFGRLRGWTRLVATTLLLVSGWQLPHRSADDQVCLPSSESHDESKHVFTPESDAGHADHCAICHWTRWLKPDLSVRAAGIRADEAGDDLIASDPFARRDQSAENLPSRAPPSALPALRPAQLA